MIDDNDDYHYDTYVSGSGGDGCGVAISANGMLWDGNWECKYR